MEKKTWSLSGFEGFAKGRFENSGQNLYVSCKGGLQRIECAQGLRGRVKRIDTQMRLAARMGRLSAEGDRHRQLLP